MNRTRHIGKLTLVMTVLLCLVTQAQAQVRKPRIRPKQENMELRHLVDSLSRELEDLKRIHFSEDSLVSEIISIYEENEFFGTRDYDQELTDSLLSLWYVHRQISDIASEEEEYDMDSVRFTTDVPDSVLIARLEKMNSFITLPFNETVKNYMVMYSEKMPKRMSKILGLCPYYMPIFEEVFHRYGLPEELKVLAIVESALNPVATSRSGAKGIWQFMLRTGKSYGLNVNSYVDERLDVEKAADAAARYLMDVYKIFGDWNLAISAYNCGAGNVNKAIRRSGGKTDFWSIYPYLPKETRGYVPSFVGACYAMTYSKEYGLVPEAVQMPAHTDTFEINRNLNFQQISDVIGIPLEDLRNLNPQYTRDIIPGNEKTYILNLPFNYTNAFIDNQDSLYTHKPEVLLGSQNSKSSSNGQVNTQDAIAYKVKSGDFLGKIASRYGVTVNQLKSWNNLKSDRLSIGQTLYIYGKASKTASAAKPAAKAAKPEAKAPETVESRGDDTIYTVKSGDSLYLIAKKYHGVSAEMLMDYNHISSSIKPGMQIRIPKI